MQQSESFASNAIRKGKIKFLSLLCERFTIRSSLKITIFLYLQSTHVSFIFCSPEEENKRGKETRKKWLKSWKGTRRCFEEKSFVFRMDLFATFFQVSELKLFSSLFTLRVIVTEFMNNADTCSKCLPPSRASTFSLFHSSFSYCGRLPSSISGSKSSKYKKQ